MKYFKILIFILLPLFGITQADYRIYPDVVYGHKAGMALTYDVIQSKDSVNGAGIIHVVSGGWNSRYFPPDSIAGNYKSYLDKGYTIFALRHGSGPRFTIPESVKDVKQGTWHIHDHCAQYGVDSTRLGIYGGSSGGQLSLMTGLEGDRHPVSAIVAFFAPANLQNIPDMIKVMMPALDFDTAQAKSVSPVLFASPDDPPTLLIHGTSDFVVAPWQSENMYKALQDNGVISKLVMVDGMGHGNSFGAKGSYYEEANNELIRWFDLYILNNNADNQ